MTTPIIIRAPRDHFHIRLNDEWHKNQTHKEAWSLLVSAGLDASSLLADAIVPPRMVSDIEFRPAGRRRWWIDGLPLPKKAVEYVLRDQVGMTKEQCELTLESLKLSYQCRQLSERIEKETIDELYAHCRRCLRENKSRTRSGN